MFNKNKDRALNQVSFLKKEQSLHASAQAQDQVERGLLLDVVGERLYKSPESEQMRCKNPSLEKQASGSMMRWIACVIRFGVDRSNLSGCGSLPPSSSSPSAL